jgi:divalent metal cation (Fe/Co/Zn/Cd) transporter
MALPLAWQIVNIAGWVAMQITTIFENVGVIQEGMMTIARPITLTDRVDAAALAVPRVREVHNVSVLEVGGRKQVSLHLKLPGELSLEEAHAVANAVERAIVDALPEVESVQTHLEPLTEEASGARPAEPDVAVAAATIARIVEEGTGEAPRELRFLVTDEGLVVFLTFGLDSGASLATAHARASELEERIRAALPDIGEVIVHTEP